jgi:DNA-binding IclR family transcriptional regulator
MKRGKPNPAPVGVIGKVLRILELLDQSPEGLQLRHVAEKTGINKSTAHRFLSHLEAEGYLFREATGTYMIGPKLARLGKGTSLHTRLCSICRPALVGLWKATGETINLAVLDGTDVLYLDVLETTHTFRLVSEVGMRRPFHCTSLGKVMLAHIEEGEKKEELLASIKFTPMTPRTITSLAAFKKELNHIRKQGFSLDDGEVVSGVHCFGAPIIGAGGEVVGAISISCPIVRLTPDLIPLFTNQVTKCARQISRRVRSQL